MVSLVSRPCARGQALLQGRAEGRLEFISGDAEQVLLVRAPVGPGACRRVNSLWRVALCDPCFVAEQVSLEGEAGTVRIMG